MRMKWKILIPVSFMFVALVILITVFSVIRFSGYTGILFEERVAVAANGLRRFMDDCEYDTKIAVIAASNDIDIINAVAGHDSAEITASLSQTLEMYHVDFFVVTDDKGIVLSRTLFPDITGDYILNQYNIEEALKGRIVTSMEEDPNVKVSVRTGAPVYNSSGLIIGAISAGVRFDTNEALDRLKDHYNAEFSVFMSGSRIATTIIRNGKRIIDSPLDQNTLDYIHSIKKDYPVNVNILGEDFSAYYMPLFDNRGEVFAIIAAAYSNQKLILERNALQSSIIITGTAGLALFIIMLLLITSGIVKPVNRLADLVSEVTHGNINVNFNNTGALNDEVGFLTHDIHLLVDVIKSILGDLSVLTVDLTNFKNTGHQIDTSKYFGSYREIIEGIKKLSDSISTMRMAMAAMDYLDTMIHVVDFDYNLLYINRIMINTYKMNGNCIGQKCYNAIKGRDTPCPGCHMAELLPDMDIGPYVNYDNIYDEITGRYYGGKSAIIRWVDGKQVLFNSVIDETQKIVYQEQLRKTLLEAEAASIAKSAFLANMSHEIRTPMNSIVGFAELAMDSEVTPITREYLHLIKENAGWLLQIINDILDISKVESGNMKFEIIPFDLHELLNSCRSIMLPRAAEKKIALQFNIDTSIENKLLGDPTKLRQVLLNLLSNAVKFTDTGSVNQFVTVKGKAGKKIDLYFLTQDSGIGMTPEQVEKAMEPFMQADISTTRKYGGTGLGLTITKNLLEMMGSRLVINSEAGRGTSIGFALTLDIAQDTEGEPDAAQGGADAQISRPMYSGEVLVCEDNQMNQRVITEHLARVGLDLEIAGNGLEGIEKVLLRKEKGIKPFDLIFMDIHMPVMDGLETAPQIIALETGTPIVAMTANVTAGEMEKYKAAGMADHLGKPFTSAELWRCLSRYFKPVEKPAAVQTAGSQDTVREDEARDKKLQDELKKDFLNKNKNRIDEIKTALDCGDIKAAHRIAHNLKSNAGLIGMAVLQEVAKQTENQLKDGENCLAPQQLDKLGAELSIVLKDLEQHYGEVQNAEPNSVALSPAEFDPAKAQALFEKLEPLLKSGNTECLNMIGDLKEIPGSAELVLQMEDFYFETALTALKDLKSKLENYRPDGSGAKFSNALSGHAKLTGALDRAVVLFNSMNSKTFKDSLAGSLSAIADAMDIDRIIIYKKAEIQGEDRMKQIYRWDRGEGGLTEVSLNYLPNTQIIMDWHNKLLKDECVNEKLGGMSSDQAEFINMFGIKSILMAPIKMNSRVLGSITFQDHRNERPFDDECISLARSFAHLCANSVIYTEMERESGEQIEFNRAMFDSSPVGIAIFDEHINIQDCNEAVLSLLGISKDYYIQHFFDLSPEYQPDGIKSRDKALDLYKRLAAGERLVLEWMHCNPAGENIPCELTVTRAVNHSKYMGLAFIKRK